MIHMDDKDDKEPKGKKKRLGSWTIQKNADAKDK
jgi:hypothetical protein